MGKNSAGTYNDNALLKCGLAMQDYIELRHFTWSVDEWSQTKHHETRHESGRRKCETTQNIYNCKCQLVDEINN